MDLKTLKFAIKNLFYFYFRKSDIKMDVYQKNLIEVREKGYSIIENYFLPEVCKKICEDIRNLMLDKNNKVWISDSLDSRFWSFEKFSTEAKNFLNDENLLKLIKKYECQKEMIFLTTLCSNIKFMENSKGSGGGWHRDRTFYKYKYTKILTYLNRVDEKNGPFQYLEKSHLFKNIVKANNVLKIEYSDKWFTNEQVKKISEKTGLKIVTLIAKPGDLIVFDGTGIHRGKPLESGERYALTNYYRFDPEEKFPSFG